MKKRICTAFLVIAAITLQAQEKINWISLNEALALQKKEPKKIMMDVYTNWCGPCKMLDKNTFQNNDVATYVNEHYYAVKFNAEGNDIINFDNTEFKNTNYDAAKTNRRNGTHDFSIYMGINAYPSIVFINEEGKFIMPLKGYQTAQQLELYLKMFKKDEHKKMTSKEKFEAYYKAFKPEFKD